MQHRSFGDWESRDTFGGSFAFPERRKRKIRRETERQQAPLRTEVGDHWGEGSSSSPGRLRQGEGEHTVSQLATTAKRAEIG